MYKKDEKNAHVINERITNDYISIISNIRQLEKDILTALHSIA